MMSGSGSTRSIASRRCSATGTAPSAASAPGIGSSTPRRRRAAEVDSMDATAFSARALELGPRLAARAAGGAALRRLPDATIADFQEAGFFDMLKPARHGGHEVDPGVFFDVQAAV